MKTKTETPLIESILSQNEEDTSFNRGRMSAIRRESHGPITESPVTWGIAMRLNHREGGVSSYPSYEELAGGAVIQIHALLQSGSRRSSRRNDKNLRFGVALSDAVRERKFSENTIRMRLRSCAQAQTFDQLHQGLIRVIVAVRPDSLNFTDLYYDLLRWQRGAAERRKVIARWLADFDYNNNKKGR